MPVFVEDKYDYVGEVAIPALGQEVTLVEIPGQRDDYIMEGWIDISQLDTGDVLDIREYVALNSTNYKLYLWRRFYGPVPEPVMRIHTKTYHKNMRTKITVTQLEGVPRSVSYVFIVEVLGTS